MNTLKLNLNLLRALDIMLKEKNITNAGKKLFLSQSAMSNSLNQCRELFHDELLIRGPNGMELTPLARDIQKKLSQILFDVNDMLSSIESFDPKSSKRKFVIGFNDRGWASQRILAPFIKILRKEAPNISVDINYVDYETRSSLKKNEVPPMNQERYMDFIIGFFSESPPQYDMMRLYNTKSLCIARKDHRYLTNPTMENYLEAEHLVVSQPFYGPLTSIDIILEKQDRGRNIAMRLADVYQAMQLLPHTDYIATLPKELVQNATNKELGFAEPPFGDETSETVSLIWDSRQTHDKAHAWLRDVIVRSCKID